MLEDFWRDYYKNGIIPNLWKGITGQQSADLQAQEQTALAREQMLQADKQFNSQMDLAKMNFQQQQQAFDYQKQLNNLQMEREDNAIQRRVADLKKAGLSPLMATEGAQAGNLISGQAPQLNADSAFANRQAAYSDAYNRRFQANQFRQQMSLQTAQLATDVMSKMISTATQIPSMLSVNDQRKWNNVHGWRNMNLSSEVINALEQLFSKFNKSSVGSGLINLGKSGTVSVIKDIGETISNNIQESVENSVLNSDDTKKFVNYGIVDSKSKFGHTLDDENYDNDRPTLQYIKEETKEKYYKSQLKNNNDDVIAGKLYDTDDYLKKHISKEDWLKTDWEFRKNYIKYGYFKK